MSLRSLRSILWLSGVLVATPAGADELAVKQACIDAHADSQQLVLDSNSTAAREHLAVCVRPECPAPVRTECAKMLMKRLGKFGYFLACSGFPACKYTESISLGPCVRPGCKGKIIERKTRKGREFYGCSRYPACDFISWDKPAHDKNCPKCQSLLFETGSRKNGFFLECKREDCGHKEPLVETAGEVEAPVT